jgi:hypothetical protein
MRLLFALAAVALGVAFEYSVPAVAQSSTVTVTAVAQNHSSVVIYFNAVPGARDYRVFDVANPTSVKYAGLTNELSATPVPATQIEWNSIGDGLAHALVVEAVDSLGPTPPGSLYNPDTNIVLLSSQAAGSMLGSDKGPTPDGKISTNGQGPYTNNPQAIARSPQFWVIANRNYRAIPSRPDATSTFFDTFEQAENASIVKISDTPWALRLAPLATYTLNAGTPLAWTLQYELADTIDSMPFIAADHFMDMLFDGGNPGTSLPLHEGHGVMAMSPNTIAQWGPGQILHITEEVDGHTDARRWMDVVIVPAADPAVAFDADTDAYNSTNNAIRFQLFEHDSCTFDIYTGPAGGGQTIPTGTAGGVNGSRLWGALGQAPIGCYISQNGLGFDDKSRFDLFLTGQHVAYFMDGQLVRESDIPAGSFPWAHQPVKIYYSHYVYHTDNDILELESGRCDPMNAFWFNDPMRGTPASADVCGIAYPTGYGFPRSDERHWDNMGFEVLPAAAAPPNNFSGLSALVQPPAKQMPALGPAAPSGLRIIRAVLSWLGIPQNTSTVANAGAADVHAEITHSHDSMK